MKHRNIWASSAACLAIAALGATAATAQSNPAPSTGSSTADSGGQEIIVTAQKTASTASKTPIALSVFSGKTLQDEGVTSVANLTNIAPSVVVGSASQGVNIAIRGVQTTDVTSKGEQSNVFNVDGIPIGRPQIIGLAFFDLDRVEVLRGPQGTLYGKSSTGGAINVITAKPKNQFEALGSFEYGNYNTRRLNAMVNVPITSTLAVRAAVNVNKRDGYLDPVLGRPDGAPKQAALNDEDNWTSRLSAKWNYADSGNIVVTGTFGHIGGTGSANFGVLYNNYLSGSAKAERQVYYNPMAGSLDDHFHVINGEINQDLGPVHFAYDGAYIDFKADDNKLDSTGSFCSSCTAADPNDHSADYYLWSHYVAHITTNSQEVRFSNSTPGRFEWVVGANYYHENIPEHDQNWQTLYSCAPSLAPSCNAPNPVIIGTTKHTSKGVFGQVNFHLTDTLKLTGGLRYSQDHATRVADVFAGGGTFLGADGAPCGPLNLCTTGGLNNSGEFKGHKITYRVGAEYQITPADMLYASVATGYKPGSFNDVDPTHPGSGSTPYGPESLTAYEAGFKGKILPNLQYNTSVYYYDYSKFQLTGATFLTPNLVGGGAPLVLIYTTIVPVKMSGWENELTWRPTRNDTLGLDWSLQGGHYSGDAFVGFIYAARVNFKGKELDLLPRFTLRGSWEHKFNLAGGATINARVNTTYNGGYKVSDFAGNGNPFGQDVSAYSLLPQQYKQKSFTRTDLTVGYTTASGKLSVEGFVHNIENKMQLLGPPQNIGVATNSATVRASDPRFFGGRVTVKY
ncbi:TonB-dependent receptor [Sphingomonas oryzagri]|uniref:TonB-dependent receptor n=1 Tax=Sphingomonas oryzagri TaxID=3042314 RepID=A0ABT6N2F1_9SPHN|nr:TonB-dependent receptor [Sphingomonas oryzagri]MDH7639253.1 TonB-dependent receptor [Sphingomonas oryzagri]